MKVWLKLTTRRSESANSGEFCSCTCTSPTSARTRRTTRRTAGPCPARTRSTPMPSSPRITPAASLVSDACISPATRPLVAGSTRSIAPKSYSTTAPPGSTPMLPGCGSACTNPRSSMLMYRSIRRPASAALGPATSARRRLGTYSATSMSSDARCTRGTTTHGSPSRIRRLNSVCPAPCPPTRAAARPCCARPAGWPPPPSPSRPAAAAGPA